MIILIKEGNMGRINKRAAALAIILIVLALISFFGLSRVCSDPDTLKGTISVLDEEKNAVAGMATASFAAAAAIDLIPGDAGRSISEGLVNLGGYFVLIFAAIYLEKVILMISGTAAFKILIPAGLVLLAVNFLLQNNSLKKLGIKLITFGLVVFLVIPTSVWISRKVEDTYKVSLDNTIEELNNETESINGSVDDTEDENAIKQIFSKAKNTISDSLNKFKAILDSMLEAVACYFVTTCIIPIIVLMLLIALIKQLFGLNINAGAIMKMPLNAKRKIGTFAKEEASE
jgi:hypothetical protein